MTFFTLVFSYGAYLFYQEASVDLGRLDQFSGKIVEKGIMTNESVTKYGVRTSQVFFIRLNGLNQILAIYNPSQSYGNIDEALKIGDLVNVHFKMSQSTDKPNLSTYQIEKDGKVILDDTELRTRSWQGLVLVLVGVIATLVIGIVKDSKYWNSNHRKRGYHF